MQAEEKAPITEQSSDELEQVVEDAVNDNLRMQVVVDNTEPMLEAAMANTSEISRENFGLAINQRKYKQRFFRNILERNQILESLRERKGGSGEIEGWNDYEKASQFLLDFFEKSKGSSVPFDATVAGARYDEWLDYVQVFDRVYGALGGEATTEEKVAIEEDAEPQQQEVESSGAEDSTEKSLDKGSALSFEEIQVKNNELRDAVEKVNESFPSTIADYKDVQKALGFLWFSLNPDRPFGAEPVEEEIENSQNIIAEKYDAVLQALKAERKEFADHYGGEDVVEAMEGVLPTKEQVEKIQQDQVKEENDPAQANDAVDSSDANAKDWETSKETRDREQQEYFENVKALKETPEYQDLRAKWLEARNASEQEEKNYQLNLDNYYGSRSGFKRGTDAVKGLFGFKPKLPDEIQKLRKKSEEARKSYHRAAEDLKDLRENNDLLKGIKEERLTRYQKLLTRKTVLQPAAERIEIQFRNSGESGEAFKRVMEKIGRNKNLIRATGFTLVTGIAGASGGLSAAFVAGTRYVSSMVLGAAAGAAVGGAAYTYLGRGVSKAESNVKGTEDLASNYIFHRDIDNEKQLADMEAHLYDLEIAKRRQKVGAITAGVAAGVATGMSTSEALASVSDQIEKAVDAGVTDAKEGFQKLEELKLINEAGAADRGLDMSGAAEIAAPDIEKASGHEAAEKEAKLVADTVQQQAELYGGGPAHDALRAGEVVDTESKGTEALTKEVDPDAPIEAPKETHVIGEPAVTVLPDFEINAEEHKAVFDMFFEGTDVATNEKSSYGEVFRQFGNMPFSEFRSLVESSQTDTFNPEQIAKQIGTDPMLMKLFVGQDHNYLSSIYDRLEVLGAEARVPSVELTVGQYLEKLAEMKALDGSAELDQPLQPPTEEHKILSREELAETKQTGSDGVESKTGVAKFEATVSPEAQAFIESRTDSITRQMNGLFEKGGPRADDFAERIMKTEIESLTLRNDQGNWELNTTVNGTIDQADRIATAKEILAVMGDPDPGNKAEVVMHKYLEGLANQNPADIEKFKAAFEAPGVDAKGPDAVVTEQQVNDVEAADEVTKTAEVVEKKVHVVEPRDNLWNILEGDESKPIDERTDISHVLKGIPEAQHNKVLDALFDHIDKPENVKLRTEIGLQEGKLSGQIYPGDKINLDVLNRELAQIAANIDTSVQPEVTVPEPASKPDLSGVEPEVGLGEYKDAVDKVVARIEPEPEQPFTVDTRGSFENMQRITLEDIARLQNDILTAEDSYIKLEQTAAMYNVTPEGWKAWTDWLAAEMKVKTGLAQPGDTLGSFMDKLHGMPVEEVKDVNVVQFPVSPVGDVPEVAPTEKLVAAAEAFDLKEFVTEFEQPTHFYMFNSIGGTFEKLADFQIERDLFEPLQASEQNPEVHKGRVDGLIEKSGASERAWVRWANWVADHQADYPIEKAETLGEYVERVAKTEALAKAA